ncbi:MAG TPA: hypothetical protein VGJ47_03885 [Gemmatimonadaceae bacterium]|jgi:hypothetical protein
MNRFGLIVLFSAFTCVVPGCSQATSNASQSPTTKADPELITMAEIEAQNFRNAYDVIQRLRPSWLTKRAGTPTRIGVRVGGGGGVQTDSGSGLVAYLDNTRLGGLDALRDITPDGIGSIQYMDAATATASLPGVGSSSVSGAIVVHTRAGH